MPENSIEEYFSTPRPLNFILAVGAGLLVALAWFYFLCRRRGLPLRTALTLLGLAVLLGGLLSRIEYLLVEVPYFDEWPSLFFAPDGLREFGFMGAVAGVLLAVWVTQLIFHVRGLGNAIALPGLLAVFLARAAEIFVPIGTGPYVDESFLQFVPLAMPDGFGDWVLSVFLFEALWAAVIFLYIRFRGHYPSSVDGMLALTLLFAGQIFFESIRAEALRVGFIRVEQVISAAGLFVILTYCQHVHESHALNAQRVVEFFVCVLLLVGAEFALDRTDWPDVFIRLVMMMVCAILASVVLQAIFVREEQFKTYAGYCPVPEGAA